MTSDSEIRAILLGLIIIGGTLSFVDILSREAKERAGGHAAVNPVVQPNWTERLFSDD